MHFLATVFLTVVLLESGTCRTGVESQENQVLRTRQRESQHTLPQIQTMAPPPAFSLEFHKCAEVETGSDALQVSFYLLISNPAEGVDLSQLSIRDTVSDITLLQSSGSIQQRGYQIFTTHSLPAGSRYEVRYTASVRGSKNEDLFLPALLTFSNTSQNEINLFGPVVANFTLRLNTTEKVYVNHALHLAGFCGALLFSTLLFSLTLISTSYLHTRLLTPQHRRRRGLRGGVETVEGVCNVSESANEEAEFEDKIVDIMALEDPQNMLQTLDNLEMSTLLRGALWVECVRVQLVRGVFRVLLGGAGEAGHRVEAVLLGQVTGMEGKLQEEQGAWLTSVAAHCSTKTQQEMELHQTHSDKLLQHADHQCVQEELECRELLEKLRALERGRVQRALWAGRDRATARAQRHMAVRRRVELHAIFAEELQEAARTGELYPDTANALLHQYYTCQLEEVLDVYVANQRAAVRERQAQRRFLVEGLQDLQEVLSHTLSSSSIIIHRWFTEIRRDGVLNGQQCEEQLERAQSELLRVKQSLEETLARQCSTAHCDIIKRRRGRISEVLCEQKREQQELECVCEGPVGRYLSRWQTLLSSHTTHYSELLTHLDQEAAGEIRKVVLAVLQEAGLELGAVGEGVCQSLHALGVPRWLLQRDVGGGPMERLRERGRDTAVALWAARSSAHQRREEELQRQKHVRLRLDRYYRSVLESQWALSEAELLRVRLAWVKCVCQVDRCLALSHALALARLHTTLTDHPDPRTDHPDTHTDHPGPRTDHPGPRTDHPGPRTDHPGPRTDHPGPRTDHPGPRTDHPDPRTDHPDTHTDHPGPRTDHPGPRTDHPDPRTDHPDPRTDHPGPRTDHPGPRTDHPGPRTDHPDPRTQKVVVNTERPLEASGVSTAELRDGRSLKRNLVERVKVLEQERERERVRGTVEEEVCAHEEEEEQVCVCEEGLGAELAAVQWERAERRSRVLETHSALLTLHTLLLQHLPHTHTHTTQQLTHTLHTHSLALEEVELQLQKEESEWEELAFGRSSDHMLIDEEEELLSVDKTRSIATNLQEALYKRQQLTHTLTDRLQEAVRRRQVIEDLRDQLELKQLYTLCDQDVLLCGELVKICGVSDTVLQKILRLLLPTVPDGELQSLTDTLSSNARRAAGPCRELVDGLRSDIISKNLSPCSRLSVRETDRLLKKKQTLVENLFSGSAGSAKGGLKVWEQEDTPPAAQGVAPCLLAPASVQAGEGPGVSPRPVMGGASGEWVWPTNCPRGDEVGVAIESTMSGQRLFVSCSPPPPNQPTEHPSPPSLPLLHTHRKRRSFLGFRNRSVAPEDQT
ncbi:uncharacterized protein LOC103039584 isoform X2 [Astyanax mexicanus]|uniref:uncharacterized protein LOC103039584 isoform X2 n=1 Tax=Astyanax mexicanus TaxID=7994 RepID=UPI0020CB5202|nr:uncharacterized protein LOC103039584 isoform X2 [Astyanax mexicanus]